MKRIIILIAAGLALSGCAENRIYTPIKVVCWNVDTGETVEDNRAVAGITVGSGWYKTDKILLEYTDIKYKPQTVDLTHNRCAIAAYRDDTKLK